MKRKGMDFVIGKRGFNLLREGHLKLERMLLRTVGKRKLTILSTRSDFQAICYSSQNCQVITLNIMMDI